MGQTGKKASIGPWTEQEEELIRQHWRRLDHRVLYRMLSHRTKAAIQGKARKLGLSSPRPNPQSNFNIVRQLKRERLLLGWSRKEVADRAGYEECCIAEWERGDNMKMLPKLVDWANALGFDLVLIPRKEKEDD